MELGLVQKYNYDEFVPEKFERWMRFGESPLLGQPAPDYTLMDLDGRQINLSEVLSEHAYTIVEFGSFT
jgi:hypothetical protein